LATTPGHCLSYRYPRCSHSWCWTRSGAAFLYELVARKKKDLGGGGHAATLAHCRHGSQCLLDLELGQGDEEEQIDVYLPKIIWYSLGFNHFDCPPPFPAHACIRSQSIQRPTTILRRTAGSAVNSSPLYPFSSSLLLSYLKIYFKNMMNPKFCIL
jgi:hypothetical protein